MIEDKFQRIHVTFKDKELEQIEQYADSRGIKKATAVKELAMRGLELTVKNNEPTLKDKVNTLLSNLDLNRSLHIVNTFIDKEQYLEAIDILNQIKYNNSDDKKVLAATLAIHSIQKHMSLII